MKALNALTWVMQVAFLLVLALANFLVFHTGYWQLLIGTWLVMWFINIEAVAVTAIRARLTAPRADLAPVVNLHGGDTDGE